MALHAPKELHLSIPLSTLTVLSMELPLWRDVRNKFGWDGTLILSLCYIPGMLWTDPGGRTEQLSSVLDVARHPTKCWMSTGMLSSTVGISGAEGHGLHDSFPPHWCSHQTPLGGDHRIWPLPVIPKSCIYWDQGTGLRSPLHSHREEAWG